MAYFPSTGDAILFQPYLCAITICITIDSSVEFNLVANKRITVGFELSGMFISWHFKSYLHKSSHDQCFLLLLRMLWLFATLLFPPSSQAITRTELFDHLKTYISILMIHLLLPISVPLIEGIFQCIVLPFTLPWFLSLILN